MTHLGTKINCFGGSKVKDEGYGMTKYGKNTTFGVCFGSGSVVVVVVVVSVVLVVSYQYSVFLL